MEVRTDGRTTGWTDWQTDNKNTNRKRGADMLKYFAVEGWVTNDGECQMSERQKLVVVNFFASSAQPDKK